MKTANHKIILPVKKSLSHLLDAARHRGMHACGPPPGELRCGGGRREVDEAAAEEELLLLNCM